jgi:hypothetical protein
MSFSLFLALLTPAAPPGGCRRPSIGSSVQPRPTKGIFVAMTVRNRTLASSGRLAA